MGLAEGAKGASNTAGDGSHRVQQSSALCSYQHLHRRNCTLPHCECPFLRRHKSNQWCRPLSQLPQSKRFPYLHMMPLAHPHSSLCRMVPTRCHTQDLQWQWDPGPIQSLPALHCCPLHTPCLQKSHNNYHHPRQARDHRLRHRPLQL